MLVKEYGFVSRGQDRYSVPILPDAGIPSIVSGNRCPVECRGGGGEKINFCEKHKALCIVGGLLLLYLILK